MEHINHNPDKKELRKFGFIFAVFFLLFFGLLIPWIWDKSTPNWVWYVSGTFATVALVLPIALGPVYRIWMKIGHVLGWINTRLILGLVFFVMFAPIALFFKIIGKIVIYTHHNVRISNVFLFNLLLKICNYVILVNDENIDLDDKQKSGSNIITIPAFIEPSDQKELPAYITEKIDQFDFIISANCYSNDLFDGKHIIQLL